MSKLLAAIGLVYLVTLFAIAAEPARAENLYRPTPVSELFDKAIKLAGYEAACKRRAEGCKAPAVVITELPAGVLGTFHWDEPKAVKMSNDAIPGSLLFNSTLVHEFVHYLQWLTGKIGPHNFCAVAIEAEQQAYDADSAYHAEFGVMKDYRGEMAMVRMNVMMAAVAGYC